MSFSTIQTTAQGRALLARAQTGTAMNFTRIKMGDGDITTQVIDDMTDVISQKANLIITVLEVLTNGKAKVQADFTNQGLASGFYWREIAVFATDPDNASAEIMYCYGNAGALADYIPAEGSQVLEKVISILTIISNAINVTATIEKSLAFITTDRIGVAGGVASFDVVSEHLSEAASETTAGHVELATTVETTTGTDAAKAVSPKNLKTELDKRVPHSLATAISDFVVATGIGVWGKKTLAEVKTLLGITGTFGTAAYTPSTNYATAAQGVLATNALPKATFDAYGATISTSVSFTLALTHANKIITMLSTSAQTITIPNETVAFPMGTQITFVQLASGTVTFTPASGTTLLSKDNKHMIDGLYASATLIKVYSNTYPNAWVLIGALV